MNVSPASAQQAQNLVLKNSLVQELICEAIKWELNKAPKTSKFNIKWLCHYVIPWWKIQEYLFFQHRIICVFIFEDSMLKKISILEFSNKLFIFLHKILFFEIFILLKILTLLQIICWKSPRYYGMQINGYSTTFLLTINCFNKTCWLSTSITIYIYNHLWLRDKQR